MALLVALGGAACDDTNSSRLSLPDGSEQLAATGGNGAGSGGSVAAGGAGGPARDPVAAPEACGVLPGELVVTPFSLPDGATEVPVSFVFVADCHGTSKPELPCESADAVGVIVDLAPELDPYANCSALHVAGSGKLSFAALIANMNSEWSAELNKTVFTPNDLSAFAGLRFWARGSGNLFVGVPSVETAGENEGGTCQPTTGLTCGDSFGAAQVLGVDWKEYRVPFSAMQQGGWGVRGAETRLDVTRVLGVGFTFVQPPTPISFELALTSVAFYKD